MVLVYQKLRLFLGVMFCIFGLLGVLLPVIPGVPIILAGLALIGPAHPWVRSLKERLKRWRKLKPINTQ